MLKINADLHCKEDKIHARSCVVEKVIALSGGQFDAFSRNLFGHHDFIKEHRDLMHFDNDSTAHCLLVVGQGREDGVIIQAEGYDYSRYSAHVPNVHSILAMDRYPALGELCRKLTEMADSIVEQGMKPEPGENRAFVSMDDLEEMSGIDVAYNNAIVSTLSGMLNDRPEIADFEIDKNEFIITPAAPDLEQSPDQEQAQEPGQTMNM